MDVNTIKLERTTTLAKNQTETICLVIHLGPDEDPTEAAAGARLILDSLMPQEAAKSSKKKTIDLPAQQEQAAPGSSEETQQITQSEEQADASTAEEPEVNTMLLGIINNSTDPEHLARILEVNEDEIAASPALDSAYRQRWQQFEDAKASALASVPLAEVEAAKPLSWFTERENGAVWMDKSGDIDRENDYIGVYSLDYPGAAEFLFAEQTKGFIFRDPTEQELIEAIEASADE